MKKVLITLAVLLIITPSLANASLASDQSGVILLQVEENGEAWYVYPNDLQKYYLGRPADSFDIMRDLGLGIAHDEIVKYLVGTFPARLSGLIMLDVENNGEAYYVYPNDLRGYYLGRPKDAFDVMRDLGLGISNVNLDQITISPTSKLTDREVAMQNNPYYSIEKRVFDVVNEHRESIGAKTLVWSDEIADIIRPHSVSMANGTIEPSHTNFANRVDAIKLVIPEYNGGAENLAWNYSSDPGAQGLAWWLTSEGHKFSLENDFYDVTGVGVAKASDGKYFITQFFINTGEVPM